MVTWLDVMTEWERARYAPLYSRTTSVQLKISNPHNGVRTRFWLKSEVTIGFSVENWV